MVIVKLSGGVGNQMFQYAVGRAYSLRNQMELKLDLSFYESQSLRTYSLEKFTIKPIEAEKKEIDTLRGKESFYLKVKRRLGLTVNRPDSYKADSLFDKTATYTMDTYHPEIASLEKSLYLDGYWQNEKFFKDFREEILEDFTLDVGLSDLEKKYLNEIRSTNSISLHVRRGDYVDNSMFKNSSLSITELEYYKKAIDYVQVQCKDPYFFIFSDDIDWCKDNFSFLNNKLFVEGVVSDIHEMSLMSNCNHNIIANSTFSWWGAWLNRNAQKIVISPSLWFKTNPTLTIVPDEWRKL